MQAQKFYMNIIRNSASTLKTYVDDMHCSFIKTLTSSNSPNLQFKSTVSENTFKVPKTEQLLAIKSHANFPMLDVPTFVDENEKVTINEILQELVIDFTQSVNITSSNFSLSFNGNLPSFEELACPELFVKTSSQRTAPPTDVLALLHRKFFFHSSSKHLFFFAPK